MQDIKNQSLTKYLPVLNKIDEVIKNNETITIAIYGKCGSGKTYFSNILETHYNCNIFHMDDFFLRPEQRTENRLKEIGGNVDYERFLEEVLLKLKENEPFTYQKFSCKTMSLEENVNVLPKTINIIEGSYCLNEHLENYYDYKIFIDIDNINQLQRIKERNSKMVNKFVNEWIPKENLYFDTFNIKDKCDVVIDGKII